MSLDAEKAYSAFRDKHTKGIEQGFIAESHFHVHQFKRLRDQETCNKFESVTNDLNKLIGLLFNGTSVGIDVAIRQWNAEIEEFTSHCIEISKV